MICSFQCGVTKMEGGTFVPRIITKLDFGVNAPKFVEKSNKGQKA
ncbi:hypothetical protein ES708_13819 [subsurface metagenome]